MIGREQVFLDKKKMMESIFIPTLWVRELKNRTINPYLMSNEHLISRIPDKSK